MNFSLSDEHEMLRDSARAFMDKEADLAPLLLPGATVEQAGYDRLWPMMAELGWPALIIPEACGGLGMSFVDLAMIVGETGAALAPSPLFGTLAGALAVMRAGSEAQRAEWLPAVAAGDRRLALAIAGMDGRGDGPSGISLNGSTVSGACHFVVDAAAADMIVIRVTDAGRTRYGMVERGAPGLSVEICDWRDITRQVCILRCDDTPVRMFDGEPEAVWPWLRDRLYLLLAAESCGGLQRVLADTVDYAKERVAFGRPIGGYQAIKHSLADIKGQVECASAAMLYAAWTLDEEDPRAPLAAAMAQSYASEAYCDATFRSIQIFGAIGFTWEMRNHLFFKRARANAVLFGSPSDQRAEIHAMLREAHFTDGLGADSQSR